VPQRDPQEWLHDIVRYGNLVQALVQDGGLDALRASDERLLAIERGLQIVTEAFTQALKQDPNLAWRITDSAKIIAFRHLLTHHYYKTSLFLLWDIATVNLPVLAQQISMLLEPQAFGEERASE